MQTHSNAARSKKKTDVAVGKYEGAIRDLTAISLNNESARTFTKTDQIPSASPPIK